MVNQSIIPTISADRLYGLNIRPQELAVYGEDVRFALRFGPTNEEPDKSTSQHFKLLVLEVTCVVPADPEHGLAARQLELVKCGWELECTTSVPVTVAELGEGPEEVPYALSQIADTVNEMARRAGLEVPMGPDLLTELIEQYRAKS